MLRKLYEFYFNLENTHIYYMYSTNKHCGKYHECCSPLFFREVNETVESCSGFLLHLKCLL